VLVSLVPPSFYADVLAARPDFAKGAPACDAAAVFAASGVVVCAEALTHLLRFSPDEEDADDDDSDSRCAVRALLLRCGCRAGRADACSRALA
jgi:hypothetical protein